MSNTLRLPSLVLLAGCALTAHGQTATYEELDTVYVLGQGETRQVQSVTAEQLSLLPAGTSPLKAIEMLPGVNFQSADPYGTYEWSARLMVRGFNQNQMGFTFDGVPLGDMTYGNHNGLHISRAAPSELIDSVQLSQGAGALATASSSNLGGALRFASASPAEEFGVQASMTGGAESARRLFGRLDTGSLGSGTRVLLSVLDHKQQKWRGAGDQKLRMYTVKAVQPVGEGTLTGYFDYSDRVEIDYQDLSYDIIDRRGWNWDNWYPDWDAAVDAFTAGDCAGAGYDPVLCDDAYWNAAGLRKDKLSYLGLDLPFAGSMNLDARVYHHDNRGQGLWGTPYVPTPGGAPLSLRTTEYDIDRTGLIAGLTLQAGSNRISFGGWYEDNDFVQARRFYGETDINAPTLDYYEFQSDPMTTQWEYAFATKTTMLYLQDEISLGERWLVNLGTKFLEVKNEARTVTGPDKDGSIKARKSFLPQAGVLYRTTGAHEFFGSVARNMRAHPSSGSSGPFSQSAEVLAATRDNLKPETSTNFELGWRYTTPALFSSLTGYHVDFKNRQLGIPQGVGILGLANVLANVGDVSTDGIELAVGWKPVPGLTWFSSISYNDSTFDNDYTRETTSGPVVVAVKGKQVPDAPKTMLRSEISYETGGLFLRVDGNYMAKRYYTYLNDGHAKSYTLFNASMGYRFGNPGGSLDELTVQLDLTNLADKKYISTLNSNGFWESDTTGTAQTLLPGAPRQWFLSLKARL